MTQIDIDTLARLARIALDDAEKEAMADDLAAVVAYGNTLTAAAPCASAEPVLSTEAWARADASLRADEPTESLSQDAILRMAPSASGEYVTVPHVLADGEGEKEGGGVCH